jgi:hypothetical protein
VFPIFPNVAKTHFSFTRSIRIPTRHQITCVYGHTDDSFFVILIIYELLVV